MGSQDPKIRDYMTDKIYTVGIDQKIEVAQELMRKHGVRHLPVLKGNKLKGVISDRDIKLALSLVSPSDHKDWDVSEVFIDDAYTVPSDTKLKKVAEEMAERKIGSVLIVEKDKPVGIFTAVDACRVLADILD